VTLAIDVVLPPAMDDSMINKSIAILQFAPMIMLCNAYWMVGNQQIFDNNYTHVDYQGQTMPSNHFMVIEGSSSIVRNTPVLYTIFIAFFITLYTAFLNEIFSTSKDFNFSMSSIEYDVDEHLPNFFLSLKNSHIHEIIDEYDEIKENYGFEIEDFRAIEKL